VFKKKPYILVVRDPNGRSPDNQRIRNFFESLKQKVKEGRPLHPDETTIFPWVGICLGKVVLYDWPNPDAGQLFIILDKFRKLQKGL